MKQSFGLVILQISGIVLGLISVFWVAGSLPAEVYAVVGIYSIMSSVVFVFSNTGLETYAIRNVLAWKEKAQLEKIKLVVTQAIVFRTLFACIVFIPLIGYAAYISAFKFHGQYFGLFVLMAFLSIARATNDAAILILKSFNMYLAAAFASYSVNVFGKLLALLFFIKFGFNVYIYTIILLPLFITAPIFLMIRQWISFRGVFYKKSIITGFQESKSFAFSSYISYIFNFLDQLLVSIFMTPEILGSFTIGKNFLSIGLQFTDNLFDPLLQGLVRFKNDFSIVKSKLMRIFTIKNYLLAVSLIIIPLVVFYSDQFLNSLRLNHYPFLTYFIIYIYLSQVVYIQAKVKYNFICLFFPQSYYLKLNVFNAVLAIVFFLIVILTEKRILFSNVFLQYIVLMWYSGREYQSSFNPLNNTK